MSSLGRKVKSTTFFLFSYRIKLLSQLAPADLQSTIAGTSDGRSSIPPINSGSTPIGAGADIQSRTTPGLVQPKGLQLGGSKASAKSVAAQLAEQVAAEEGGNNIWVNGDLMDVNADEGDWSKFIASIGVYYYMFTFVCCLRCVRECACRCSVDTCRPWIWCFASKFSKVYVGSWARAVTHVD